MAELWDVDSGDLRNRVQIYAPPGTTDDYGQGILEKPGVDGWTLVTTVWGNKTPASGERFTVPDQVRTQTTHKVVLRYLSWLTTRHRLVIGGRVANILALLDEGNLHVRHTVLCQEAT